MTIAKAEAKRSRLLAELERIKEQLEDIDDDLGDFQDEGNELWSKYVSDIIEPFVKQQLAIGTDCAKCHVTFIERYHESLSIGSIDAHLLYQTISRMYSTG